MAGKLKADALAIAYTKGHYIGLFRPIPYMGPGLIEVAFCKNCRAAIVYRSRPIMTIPAVEGSALTTRCPAERRPDRRRKKMLTPPPRGV